MKNISKHKASIIIPDKNNDPIKANEHLSHFRTSGINTNEINYCEFIYKNREYIIDFHDERIKLGFGYSLKSTDDEPVEYLLLKWLTLYFGESADDPYAVRNNTHYIKRGYLTFNRDNFKIFIKKVDRFPFISYTKWRNELLRKSLLAYCMGVQLSVSAMPITIGQFALSIEGLSNAYLNNRNKYNTLGGKPYKNLINKRLAQLKKSKNYADCARKLSKDLEQEIDVITEIRNLYCGHSLIHSKKERDKFRSIMNKWAVKHGWDKKNTKRKSFRDSIMEQTLALHSSSIYKLSMNTNRIIFFFYFNLIRNLPFTNHDFNFFGPGLIKELFPEYPIRTA